MEEPTEELKLIFVHGTGVGATSIINTLIDVPFELIGTSNNYYSLVEYNIKYGNKKYILNLWDTATNERFKTLNKLFIKGANIVIFIYDITRKETFNQILEWIQDVKNILGTKIICGILGNKMDLLYNQEVKEEEVEKLAKSNKMKFKSVSCLKEPKNIKDFIEELFQDYLFYINNNIDITGKLENIDIKSKNEDFYLNKLNINYIQKLTKYYYY